MSSPQAVVTRAAAAERVYRVAFHAYPRRWRWRHQNEALEVLLERADERHGRVSWADCVNLLWHGLGERVSNAVRVLRRLTPLAKVGVAAVVAAVAVTGVEEVDLDAVRGPSQAEVRTALPATAQINTTRCPAHPPSGPDPEHSPRRVVHVLGYQLEPLDADRLLLCRWNDGDPGTGILTGQRLVTDQTTITAAQEALNSLRHSRWHTLFRSTPRGPVGPATWVNPVTELIFGTGRSAVSIGIPQPDEGTHGFFSNGILAPLDDNTAVDTLANQTVPRLLGSPPTVGAAERPTTVT